LAASPSDILAPADPHSSVNALVFDVFGTVVDWRGSIIREGQLLGKRKGIDVDWVAFADAWRGGYQPAMQRVRSGQIPWTNIDGLNRLILNDLILKIIREAMDEAIRRGLSEAAARDFILGHLNVELAILFNQLPGVRMSDAANKTVERAKKEIFAPDWKKVFERDAIAENIRMITSV
jgi:hypothetical protein